MNTIDLTNAIDAKPNIEELLMSLGLTKYATVHYDPTSYTWQLMRMIDEDSTPRFDFCYIDGAHTWAVDGLAFYLVDRLLKPGGLIIFDDLDWSFATSPTMKELPEIKSLPEYEYTTPQVRKIYELLCKPHPAYGDFMEKDGWAFAWKLNAAAFGTAGTVRTEKVVVVEKVEVGLGAALMKIARKLRR